MMNGRMGIMIVFFSLFVGQCRAQERELKDLAASLTAQVKQRAKGPVAVTSFIGGNGYCPSFSSYIVDRLNVFLVKGNTDFDVVTRERVEEVFKEINLALGKNYDAATFAKVGKQLGAKSLIRGSYTIQSLAATVSIAAQLLDIETGRIIGGDVIEIPYTGDLKATLNERQCASDDSEPALTHNPGEGLVERGTDSIAHPKRSDTPGTRGDEVKRIGQLEVKLKGCRLDPEGLVCAVFVTNLGSERQYCLVSKADTMMSRIVDERGAVNIPFKISLAEQSGAYQMWECAHLPSGIPVAASLLFKAAGLGPETKLPDEGSRLKLVEFGFDIVNYASRSPTSMFAQFRDVAVTR